MGVFGYENFQIDVSCTAEINISNTDIMFVLDVTGSMNCAPDNPGGGNCGNTPDPGSKIDALRVAVMSFYDAVDDATAAAATGAIWRRALLPPTSMSAFRFRANSWRIGTPTSRALPVSAKTSLSSPATGSKSAKNSFLSDQWEWLPRNLSNFGSTKHRARTASERIGPIRATMPQNFCWNTLPGTYNVGGDTWEVFSGTHVLHGRLERRQLEQPRRLRRAGPQDPHRNRSRRGRGTDDPECRLR